MESQVLQVIKALSEKFDALQQDVETLKMGSSQETAATQDSATTQETVAIQATPSTDEHIIGGERGVTRFGGPGRLQFRAELVGRPEF